MNKPWIIVGAHDGDTATTVETLTHPDYDREISDWNKFRLTFRGGHDFVNNFLRRFSIREDVTDFNNRREISYSPSHAKAAVVEIKNAIYQRLIDITRAGGPITYQEAIVGKNRGVDWEGNTMDQFMGRIILPELLSMRKVGIYIDKPPIPEFASRVNAKDLSPYIYHYQTEDIRSWTFNRRQELIAVLLRDHHDLIDVSTGLPNEVQEGFRLLQKTDIGIVVRFFDDSGNEHMNKGLILDLPRIPFVILEINQSLLTDIADYQIALLNIASSDLNYSLKSNFPFYTEQYSPLAEMPHVRQAQSATSGVDGRGEATEAQIAKKQEISTGVAQGRRYPKGLDRPGFINPSSEPLIASMKKGEEMRAEIRQLLNLSLASIRPVQASAESKERDDQPLEAGLSYIGMEMEFGEQRLAQIWSDYERFSGETVIKYPERYSLRSDLDRRREAKELAELRSSVPSKAYQKKITKQIIETTVGGIISATDKDIMFAEVDAADVIITDPDTVREDHEAGFVGTKLASKIRGYPDGEAEKAQDDHAERLARIAAAQSKEAGPARGVNDRGDSDEAAREKELARQRDEEEIARRRERGGAQ